MAAHVDSNTAVSPPPTPRTTPVRKYSLLDRLVTCVDQALRAVSGASVSARPYPAEGLPETVVDERERRHVAALMRVNHAGEIAAQALYQGQALAAPQGPTREALLEAGREEADHLAWCAARIRELNSRTSLLDPFWYAGSFAIGLAAGLAGDRISLGFVAETERQVVEHLRGHLERLPHDDARTRAILEQMSADEERHGRDALLAGGVALPAAVRTAMRMTARVMTRTAYRI